MNDATTNGVHFLKIPRGHARLDFRKDKDGAFYMFFCFAKEYKEPGTTTEKDDEEVFPIVGVKLWGKEHAEIIGNAFIKAAETMPEEGDES